MALAGCDRSGGGSLGVEKKALELLKINMNMKYILILLLASTGVQAQNTWRQVRKMAFNGTVDEWRKQGDTMAIVKDTIRIHDTVYLLKTQYDSMFAAKSHSDSVILETGSIHFGDPIITFSSSGAYWSNERASHMRFGKNKKKHPVKKPKPQYEVAEVQKSSCILDTIPGLLVYNNRRPEDYNGNVYGSGYWVGCRARIPFIRADNFLFLPGRYKSSDFYGTSVLEVKEKITGSYEGKFYTDDGTNIPNYRVYQLIIKP